MSNQEKVKEYKKGDVVWYVASYNPPLAIKCKIDQVEDQFRKKHPDAYLFYWLDEPVGHAVSSDELYDTREQAESEFNSRVAELKQACEEEGLEYDHEPLTLEKYRQLTIEFIKKTWEDAGHKFPEDKTLLYPDKEEGTEWFSI